MIISNRGLFRKLFRFYTLIISYIPKRGHLNVIISTKSLFIIISNSNVLKNLSKNISKLVFLDFQRKKKPKNWSPYRGGSRIFFLGEGALVSCSSSTPINHIVFFLEDHQLYQKTAGHLRGVRTPCTLPLDPPLPQRPN